MFNLTITAESMKDMKKQLLDILPMFSETAEKVEEVRVPVITQAQVEENIKNAPEHKLPDPPTIEEVRAALKELRGRKGAGAVKEILKAYGVDNLTLLKPEDYAGAMDRALTEV